MLRTRTYTFVSACLIFGMAVAFGETGLGAVPSPSNFSFTGNLDANDDVEFFEFTLDYMQNVTIQTYHSAGGTNAQGTVIPGGSFDPILALFSNNGNILDVDDDGGAGLDSYINQTLGAGMYLVGLSVYSNFPNGPNLDDGYQGDGGDYGNTFYALDILNVDSAGLLGESSPPPPRRHRPREIVVVDTLAMASAIGSGLPFGLAQREIQFDATRTALRDLNGRLFRHRSLGSQPTEEVAPPAPKEDLMGYDKNGDEVYAPAKSSKNPVKTVVMQPTEVVPPKTLGVFANFDFSATDQDARGSELGYDAETYAGSLGLEYRPVPTCTAGIGVIYLKSDAELGGNLGDVDIEGWTIAPYISHHSNGFYLDLLYGITLLDNEFSRNTGLGRDAKGDADSINHTGELNIGYNFEVGGLITGPIGAVEYLNGSLDGYTENGGGNANVVYDDQDYESLLTRLGWQASLPIDCGNGCVITPQVRASWNHEWLNSGDSVDLELKDSPFARVRGNSVNRFGEFGASAETTAPGDDYLSAGGGVSVTFGDVFVLMDYEGHFFRDNAGAHYASLRIGAEF